MPVPRLSRPILLVANRYKLSKSNLSDKLFEINKAGVDLARRVIMASFKQVFLAGDIGPLGIRLAPLGVFNPNKPATLSKNKSLPWSQAASISSSSKL